MEALPLVAAPEDDTSEQNQTIEALSHDEDQHESVRFNDVKAKFS